MKDTDTTNLIFQQQLEQLRADLNELHPEVNRLAIALYHEDRDTLQTFVCSEDKPSFMNHYESKLGESESLSQLASSGKARTINNMDDLKNIEKPHVQKILNSGYRSNYTIPLVLERKFIGFLFANSFEENVFKADVVLQVKLIAMVMGLLIQKNQARIGILKSTVESMKLVSSHRDPETGAHLHRMANYSLLIAMEIADDYELSDVRIDYLYLYSPMHDIGKINVPDHILLKPGPLDAAEFEIMKLHTTEGSNLIQRLVAIYDLADMPFIEDLQSLVRWHHERPNGEGYPDGLIADEIPIIARIVAVADVFDALTSVRPYKKAWTLEESIAELKRMASRNFLDPICVEALIKNLDKIKEIMAKYGDDSENADQGVY